MKMFENLENRQMLSVDSAMLIDGELYVQGDDTNQALTVEGVTVNGEERIRLTENGNTVHIYWYEVGDFASVPASEVKKVEMLGMGGDDVLSAVRINKPINWYGADGNDTIRPGSGKDAIDGGSGVDTVDYSKYSKNVEVHLDGYFEETSGVIGSLTDRDALYEVENARGGKGNDVLVGDEHANKLWGGAGDDKLTGGDGADSVFGEDGNDKVFAAEHFDALDKYDGGSGRDILYGKMRFDAEANFEFHG